MTNEARMYNGGMTVSSINGAGKTGQLQVKQIRTFSHTIYKNKIKMGQKHKHKTRNHKTPRREHRQYAL